MECVEYLYLIELETATQYKTVIPPAHALIYTPSPPLPAALLSAPYGHTTSYWLCHFPAPTQLGINTPHTPSTDILHSPAYEDGTDSEFRNVGN